MPSNEETAPSLDQQSLSKGSYGVGIALQDVPDHYCCSHCHFILHKPRQLPCENGHRVCATCLTTLFSEADNSGSVAKCPVDGTTITRKEAFNDIFAEREILSLKVKCPSRIRAPELSKCGWESELRNVKDHEKGCKYIPLPCPNGCGDPVIRGDMSKHLENECRSRLVRCNTCGDPAIPFDKMADHEQVCPDVKVTCPNKCPHPGLMKRAEVSDHLATCPKEMVTCPYQFCGCTFKGPRDMLPEHDKVNMGFHLQICSRQAQENKEKNALLVTMYASLMEKVVCMEKCFSELSQGRLATGQSPNTGASSTSTSEGAAQATLSVSQLQQLDTLRQLSSVQEQRLATVERTVALQDVQLSNISIRQDLEELKTTDGVLVWKIRNFQQHQQEAISGRAPSIYSPPFFTNPSGYKVCARLYPNGDGIGRGTHLSLFFVIMKGDYDALLPWPFQQKVSLVLLDQGEINRRDVVETFWPDPNSTSFQRPEQEMNVGSGYPPFVSFSTLNRGSYLRNDTLFIKIVVHQFGVM